MVREIMKPKMLWGKEAYSTQYEINRAFKKNWLSKYYTVPRAGVSNTRPVPSLKLLKLLLKLLFL